MYFLIFFVLNLLIILKIKINPLHAKIKKMKIDGQKYLDKVRDKQILLKKELRKKFLEKCKLYKEQKSFSKSGFLIFGIIEILGFIFFLLFLFSQIFIICTFLNRFGFLIANSICLVGYQFLIHFLVF